MTYDEYTVKVRARMKKLVLAENFIKKYRFLIIAVADIIFVAFIFTMYFAGSYIKDLSVHNVVYGEEGITRAAAFLSDVKYKYIENGEELTGLPYGAGEYDISAETKNPFGVVRRQNASLTIYKKSAFIKLSDFSVEYGESPDVKSIISSSDLVSGDVITEAEVKYDLYAKSSDAQITGITIVNRYGKEVTSSYDLKFGTSKATVTPRKITVDTGSAEKKYDWEDLFCHEYEITQGSLAYNDEIKVDFNSVINVPGTLSNKADIKVFSNGVDVSEKYSITERIGSLTIHPLEITIKTGSAEKEYDQTPLCCTEYEIISSELLEGHHINAESFPQKTDPGAIYNTITFNITDDYGRDVNYIYDIKLDKGIIRIKGRKITLKSASSSYVYSGMPHNANRNVKIVSGQLYEHDYFSTYNHPSEVMAGEYQNTFSVKFSGIVPKDAYDIEYDYGTLTILKKPLVLNVEIRGSKRENKEESKTAFTAHISGNVAGPDQIASPMYIPIDVTYDAFENYIARNLKIYHGSFEQNAVGSYDITYNIEYDKDELDDFRKTVKAESKTGNTDQSGQGTMGNGTDHGIPAPGGDETDVSADEKYGPSGIGSGGVGGGIDNSPSPYVYIPDSAPDIADTAVGSVSSFREGAVYLRLRSFGNYTGEGWAEPAIYEGNVRTHPLNMTYTTLIENKYTEQNELEVKYNAEDGLVPVPYYSFSSSDGKYVMTDVAVPKDKDGKNTYYYSQIPVLSIPSLLSLDDKHIVSDSYREFVYDNYLSLPESTEIEIKKIIEQSGLDASSPTVISDVIYYVKHAAVYNGAFEKIPEGMDRVIYFLTRSKEGVCGHFASAATLIYRALGIPARYTVGYYVVTEGKYKTVKFYEKDAHAWPEIFVDGIGWVPVEVTSSSVSEGGVSDRLQPPQSGEEIFYNKLYYQMASVSKVYDGEPLYSDTVELLPGSNLRQGDVIKAKTESVRYTGTFSFGSAEFAVYDENNVDVTLLYDVQQEGKAELTVLPRIVDMRDIELYVGQTISAPSYENALDEEAAALLPSGYLPEFSFETDSAIRKDGEALTGIYADKDRTLKIFIDFGTDDELYYYFDGAENGAEMIIEQKVTVLPFENVRIKDGVTQKGQTGTVIRKTGENGRIYNYIAVRSADAEKSFDGTYLHSSDYEILSGALENGHRLEVECGAGILYVGEADNLYLTLKVKDEAGVDVTGEYLIDFYPGKLTVTPGEYEITDENIEVAVDEKLPLNSENRTAGISGVRVSYGQADGDPIVRVQGITLIGIEPGQTDISATYYGTDLNGDGKNEYNTVTHLLSVSVKPKKQPDGTGVYIALAGSVSLACAAVIFAVLKAAEIKKEMIKKAGNKEIKN